MRPILVSAVAGVLLALASPSFAQADGFGFAASKSKGKECYQGKCSGCKEDCSAKKTVRSCYQCCNDNCLSTYATQCQDFCDGTSSMFVRQLAMDATAANRWLAGFGDRLDRGVPFTHQEVVDLEFLSVRSGAESIRRVAMATMSEAFDASLVPEESRGFVSETMTLALESPMDFVERATAMAMVRDYDVEVDRLRVLPALLVVAQGGLELDREIAEARPEWTESEVRRAANRHRLIARDAAVALLSR